MKPPEWRKQRAPYPLTFQVQTRYRDQDLLAHLNNVAIAEYFDDVREQIMRSIRAQLDPSEHIRVVTASMAVTYLAEAYHPDTVDIGAGILKIGNTSFEIGEAMFQNGQCVAICTATLVQSLEGRKVPIAPKMRAILDAVLVTA